MRKKIFIVICLLWLFALTGCAGIIRSVDPGEKIVLSEREALIFGKIIFIENNEEKIPYGFWGSSPRPALFHLESGNRLFWNTMSYDKDGGFYWVVPIGTYLMTEIQFAYSLQPQIVFQVPPSDADAFYLGVLRVSTRTDQLLAATILRKVNSIEVTDEFDTARETLLSRNPGFSSRIGKSLMIHHDSIPVDPDFHAKKSLWQTLDAIATGLRPVRMK